MLYGCDRRWWSENHAVVAKSFPGELWSCNEHAEKVFHVNRVKSQPGGGVSRNPEFIREGGNSGFQAIGLALLFGARRIVLLGFDMQLTGRKTHWHGDHQGSMGNPTKVSLQHWRDNFEQMARELPPGVEIINATGQTALTCFPRKSLEESLLEHAAQPARTNIQLPVGLEAAWV